MRTIERRFVAAVTLFAGLAIVLFIANVNAGAANHGQLAEDVPRTNLPIVLDGEVLAHAQIGNRIFVGGDFQRVRLGNGTTVTQPYIFAYDINNGDFDQDFRPAVDGIVEDLATSPNGADLYASGRFTNWDGQFVRRLAKLSPNGTRDVSFTGGASAVIRSLAVTDDTVYMAGNFVTVNNSATRIGFGAVDRFSGATDQGFVMNVQNSVLGAQTGRRIVATSDGNTVFGLHHGTQINGQPREALVKINVGANTATLANWRVDWSGQAGNRNCLDKLRDLAISPDDSFIVIGGQGADNPPNCDSVLRYNTGGTGVIPFRWAARMYSSVFSLAVSDVAVYVGGHFCSAPRNGAPVGGITHQGGTANGCEDGGGNRQAPHLMFPNDAVARNQMAALDRNNGRALDWDPGSNNQLAVHDLTVIDRGLLAGHDRDRFNNRAVGRSGFFDFGGFTPPIAPPASASCAVALNGNDRPVITWSGFNNVDNVQVRRNGSWISSGGGGSGSVTDANVTAGTTYRYEVRYRPGGTTVDVSCTPNSITIPNGGGGPDTTPPVIRLTTSFPRSPGTFNLSGTVVDDNSGVDRIRVLVQNEQTRQYWNGTSYQSSWVWNVGTVNANGTWTLPNVNFGAVGEYEIRLWSWDNEDNRSDPASTFVDVAPGGGGQSCTATTNANGSVTLRWTAIAGETRYQVRRNGSWLTTSSNLSFTHAQAQPGDSYLIRSEQGGVTTEAPCV